MIAQGLAPALMFVNNQRFTGHQYFEEKWGKE
jgi:hypothetical protein